MSTHTILDSLMRTVSIGYLPSEKKFFVCEETKNLNTGFVHRFTMHDDLVTFVASVYGRRQQFSDALAEVKQEFASKNKKRQSQVIDWTSGIPM